MNTNYCCSNTFVRLVYTIPCEVSKKLSRHVSSIKDISISIQRDKETEESIIALGYDQLGVASLPLEQPPEEIALTDQRENQ